MSLIADARILMKMLAGMPKTDDMATNLEGFYAGQADAYDAFRARLLHGRRELMAKLNLPVNAHVVELGGGTGQNLDYLGSQINQLYRYEIIDLCPSLLSIAQQRAISYSNVSVIEANACTYQPSALVDCVIFSYSLTMMPDWQAALNNAKAILKPNGVIAVVDFTLSKQQSRLVSFFWRKWFAHDGVHLNPEIPKQLQALFTNGEYKEYFAKVPYLPFLKVPYYLFTL